MGNQQHCTVQFFAYPGRKPGQYVRVTFLATGNCIPLAVLIGIDILAAQGVLTLPRSKRATAGKFGWEPDLGRSCIL